MLFICQLRFSAESSDEIHRLAEISLRTPIFFVLILGIAIYNIKDIKTILFKNG